MTPAPRRRPSIALGILATGFLLSASLRAGTVVAALPSPGDGFGNPVAETPARGAEPVPAAPDLRAAQERLAERARDLDARERTLEAVEERLRTRLEELEAARLRLERTAAVVEDAAGRDVRHLAAMYETMKPKQAAVIFDRMTPSFAAGFLGQMDADAAALILANMDADKAYAVSLLLASRNIERDGPRP